jgi:methionine-rich copper-binding protein CopC
VTTVFAVLLLLLLFPSAAFGHGEIEKTVPEQGERLSAPPDEVTITLTEAPSQGAVLRVLDGCKDNLVDEALITERDLHSPIATGQPGKWTVAYRAVSAEDGHLTKGRYTFTVAGKKDCSAGNDNDDDDAEIGPGTSPIVPDDSDEGGGFPVVPVAIGGALVVAAAVAIRVGSDRAGS